MNIRDFKYLVALAEHRHFGKAAEICHVSQPALSMQIKKLEENLGTQLLERNNKSVLLTEIGIVIAKQAQEILRQVDEMRATAQLAKDPESGELRIGIIPTLAPYLLPHIIPQLAEKFPKLAIYLVEEQTAILNLQLAEGKLDTAILALPLLEGSFYSIPLFEEEFLLAVSPQHTLAQRKEIKSIDLENQSLLLLESGHCLRDQALAVCQRVKAKEMQSFQATSLETLRHMVAANRGITLMPALACKVNDGITYIPFTAEKPTRTIGMAWRTSTAKQIILKNISQQIKKIMLKQKIRGNWDAERN